VIQLACKSHCKRAVAFTDRGGHTGSVGGATWMAPLRPSAPLRRVRTRDAWARAHQV